MAGTQSYEVPLVAEAQKHIGTVETCGDNCGPKIRRWMQSVGLPGTKGRAWCGGFVSAMMDAAGVETPELRSARTRDYRGLHIPTASFVRGARQVPDGYLALYKTSTYRGHIGIVSRDRAAGDRRLRTISGNTENPTSPSVDGVFEKTRSLSRGSYFRPIGFIPVTYER